MDIRRSTPEDLPRMLEIYEYARRFMAEHGNPLQWGPTRWPPEALLRRDIEEGDSYVCLHQGRVVGTFFFRFGPDAEPTYRDITGGQWGDESPPIGISPTAAGGTRAPTAWSTGWQGTGR